MPQRQEGEPPPLPSGCELCLREATLDDLDDLVEIVRVGFPDDPEVGYRFPHRDRYPQDYVKWTRREYEGYLAQPGKFVVRVIESTKPIALAVWDIAVLTKSNNSGLSMSSQAREWKPAEHVNCRYGTE